MSASLPLVDPSDSRCVNCRSLCCHGLTLPMRAPVDAASIADIRWRLHFDSVEVYRSGDSWFMVIAGACQYLDQRGMCTIYDLRPQQCRDYHPPYCERYVDPADLRLRSPEDLDAYLGDRD